MATNRRQILVLVLVSLVVLAGCSGMSGSDSGDGPTGAQSGGGGGDAGGDGAEAERAASRNVEQTSADAAIQARQALIRTGRIHLNVSDYDAARQNLTRDVQQQGGFVSDSTEHVEGEGNATWTTGRIVYRVPAENFSAFFERAKAEGDVISSGTNTTDVTDRLVDIEARLTNLRAQRNRLRTLYRQANDTEDVLAVGEKLSEVQEEIERLEARKRTLENRVSYATVTVRLSEPRPDVQPDRESWYDTPIVEAFLESVDGVIVVIRAIVVGGAYLAPYLVVFGIPLVGIGLFFRRWSG